LENGGKYKSTEKHDVLLTRNTRSLCLTSESLAACRSASRWPRPTKKKLAGKPPVLDPEFAEDVIHYRDLSGFAVIDFKKFKKPVLTEAPQFQHPARAEALGHNGLLLVSTTHPSAQVEDPEYEVFDISNPARPTALAIVQGVQQRLERSETGTLFLLGDAGLTLIETPRRGGGLRG